MTKKSPVRATLLYCAIAALLCPFFLSAQDCGNPSLICAQLSTDTANTGSGVPQALPASFCFSDAPNALFYEFNTLNLSLYPDQDFLDGSADLSLFIDSCVTDTLFSQGVNVAVFEATDLCNSATYQDPVACAQNITESSLFSLTDLEPSTTYYVIVSGLFDPDEPNAIASECVLSLTIAGPAVEYDISADPPTAQNQSIFPGQTAELAVNPNFEPVEWFGESLSDFEGASVTASPTEFGAYSYMVQTEVEGCTIERNFLVTVVPPITPYTAFTPNNDGFNDTWVIDRIQQFQNAQIVVYSRWGSKVFQTTNYRNDWDGDDLPAATYYFIIELNDPDNFDAPPVTGAVTLVR